MEGRSCRSVLVIAAIALGAGGTGMAAQPTASAMIGTSLLSAPDMLGTRAIPIRADRFSDSLRRARQDASASPALQRLIAPARPLPPLQKVAFVQRAVTSSIRWISDATEWGRYDYWASASQTLAHGAGDAKNRAIVKFQALRALGFNNSDLFLTLARDRIGGPLTVLTVRSGGRYYVVDDTGAPPFPVEQRRFEFQPLMSFGMYGAWVHVRPMAPTAIAAINTTSSAFARK